LSAIFSTIFLSLQFSLHKPQLLQSFTKQQLFFSYFSTIFPSFQLFFPLSNISPLSNIFPLFSHFHLFFFSPLFFLSFAFFFRLTFFFRLLSVFKTFSHF